jgi:ligand-binding SRPBCC domain-containing protein
MAKGELRGKLTIAYSGEQWLMIALLRSHCQQSCAIVSFPMRIRIETFVPTAPEIVCAMLLDPETHARTAPGRERVVAGSSPLKLDDEVTFEATHFGVRQRLTARITFVDPPHAFEDVMVRGAFRRLWHRHEFHAEGEGTRMVDLMDFASPLGGLFDRFVLGPYLRRFLAQRGEALARLVLTH